MVSIRTMLACSAQLATLSLHAARMQKKVLDHAAPHIRVLNVLLLAHAALEPRVVNQQHEDSPEAHLPYFILCTAHSILYTLYFY